MHTQARQTAVLDMSSTGTLEERAVKSFLSCNGSLFAPPMDLRVEVCGLVSHPGQRGSWLAPDICWLQVRKLVIWGPDEEEFWLTLWYAHLPWASNKGTLLRF